MLFRRGDIVAIACTRYRRGTGRYTEHVYIAESPDKEAFSTYFFYGACVNCLAVSTARCSLNKFTLWTL